MRSIFPIIIVMRVVIEAIAPMIPINFNIFAFRGSAATPSLGLSKAFYGSQGLCEALWDSLGLSKAL